MPIPGAGALKARSAIATVVAVSVATAIGGRLAAQTALAQLGLTEATARRFVLDEIKTPARDRRSAIAIAGTRAFLKLPPSARAAAATGLFAWAKAYVNSPAFRASYDSHRRDRLPQTRQDPLTVDEAIKKDIDEQLAGLEQMKQGIASLPPDDQRQILAKLKEAEAMVADPEQIKARREALEAERARERESLETMAREVEDQLPADPQRLFARRLREFLGATTDVNFSARTLSLAGGPDGIEFLDRADRQRHWIWQQAVIVGPEATAAARAAAQAWLHEVER